MGARVESLSWYERVDTVRPVGKGVLLISGVSAATFLYTANCLRLSTPLLQAQVVWTQFGLTVATGTVALTLLLKPCWKDPTYRKAREREAIADLGRMTWREFGPKWYGSLSHMPDVRPRVEEWLANQVRDRDFFDFLQRHGVDYLLPDLLATLKEKYDPAAATYTQVWGARVELERLGVNVDEWLGSRLDGFSDIDDLEKAFPTALADGALAHHHGRVAKLLTAQVRKEGWSTSMERYQRYYAMLDYHRQQIVASIWSQMAREATEAPTEAVKRALDGGTLLPEHFQEWVLRTTKTIEDITTQFVWAKDYLNSQGQAMRDRVFDHYILHTDSNLHQNPLWLHLVPPDLLDVLENDRRGLASYLEQNRSIASLAGSFHPIRAR